MQDLQFLAGGTSAAEAEVQVFSQAKQELQRGNDDKKQQVMTDISTTRYTGLSGKTECDVLTN